MRQASTGKLTRLSAAGGCPGVALAELLVAVSLLAVLAAAAVLGHRELRAGLDLRLAARQVVLDLKLARMRAIRENINHRIVFAAGADRYRPQRKSGAVYVDAGGAVALPAGISIVGCTAKDAAISFRPRGNAGSFGTVTLGNVKGAVRRVVVDIAGAIRVE